MMEVYAHNVVALQFYFAGVLLKVTYVIICKSHNERF